MKKILEKTGVRDDTPLEVSENNRKAKEDSKKKHQKYQMTDEEVKIWLEMLSLSRKYFRDMRFSMARRLIQIGILYFWSTRFVCGNSREVVVKQ